MGISDIQKTTVAEDEDLEDAMRMVGQKRDWTARTLDKRLDTSMLKPASKVEAKSIVKGLSKGKATSKLAAKDGQFAIFRRYRNWRMEYLGYAADHGVFQYMKVDKVKNNVVCGRFLAEFHLSTVSIYRLPSFHI